MQNIFKDINLIRNSLKEVCDRLDSLEASLRSAFEKDIPTGNKRVGDFSKVVEVVWRSRAKNGVSIDKIAERTGFDKKKVSRILSQAKKENLVKNLQRGYYAKR